MLLTHKYNIPKNDILSRLGTSSDFGRPCIFEIRSVFRRDSNDNWKLCAALIRKSEKDKKNLSHKYKDHAFFIHYKEFSKVQEILHYLYGDGIIVDSNYPAIKTNENTRWEEELIPSFVSQSGKPIRHLSTRIDSRNYIDSPLLGYKLNYHSSFNTRLHEFISYETKSESCIHLILNDDRSKLSLTNNKVSLLSSNTVSVVGELKIKDNIKKVNFDSKSNNIIDITDATLVELWVLDKNNQIFDYISSSAHPYQLKTDNRPIEKLIHEKIENGETIDCEFKKFINLEKGDTKPDEIDRTICAFSNTIGGHLIIGVTDNGEIIGVDEDVRKQYRTSPNEAINTYIKNLCKRLYENLTSNDCFTVTAIDLLGKKLIIINASKIKSQTWNFIQATDIPYKRKGATNYNATRLVALDYESSKHNNIDSIF